MKIGLFFGSFNPVHVGHMIIANTLLNETDLDRIWMVVSPHNPLKKKSSLANDFDRLHLVRLAIGSNLKIKASNIEFDLPRPSYTIDTLSYLKEKYPSDDFSLIMGSDNLNTLPKWKNHEQILKHYSIVVYHRPGQVLGEISKHPQIQIIDNLPLLDISSTYIRSCIRSGKSIQYLVPDSVFEYMEGSNMYKN